MDSRVMEFLLKNKEAEVNFEKSTTGIIVPTPVIYVTDILENEQLIIFWYGDMNGKQIEFPLCVPPDYFDKELAADSLWCEIWFVGSLTELRKSRFGFIDKDNLCQRNFGEEIMLACGVASGTIFVFEIVLIGDNELGVIKPTLYIKEERMSPGGVELEF